jgi:hypothetical protein
MPGGGFEKGAQLLGGPRDLFYLGDRPQAGSMGDEGDVARDEPAPHGVSERAADDQMDLVHRLGRQGGAPVVGSSKPL